MDGTRGPIAGASPDAPARPVAIIVMGTQGVGKTTLGTLLAERLGVGFIDGDRLHPPANVERMASGRPLDDDFDVILLVRASDARDLRRIVLEDIQASPSIRSTRTTLVFEDFGSE